MALFNSRISIPYPIHVVQTSLVIQSDDGTCSAKIGHGENQKAMKKVLLPILEQAKIGGEIGRTLELRMVN